MSKLVLKICCSTWENESRDKRELSVCRELGADVLVLAKGNSEDKGRIDYVDGFEVRRYSTRPLKHVPNAINRIFSLVTWARYAKKLKPDIISGHDITGVLIGWMSTWFVFKKNKPLIVYDSHEFELGLSKNQKKLKWLLVCFCERFFIKRCKFSIMVNDSIAEKVRDIHRMKDSFVVVRNTPLRWELDFEKISEQRNKYADILLTDNMFIVLYHGAIMKERGVEQLLEAISLVKDVQVVVLGNGEQTYLNYLRDLVVRFNIDDRVLFLSAVPLEELQAYVGAADVGVSLLQGSSENHMLALPNKFFENIQSLTPVIVSDFPEIGKMVDKYEIGIKVAPDSPEQIADAILKLKNDKLFYESCKKNLLFAKEELCWENEKDKLKSAYEVIID